MKNIGVGGQMASGKDTLSDYLVQKLGSDWIRNAFANAVKKVFCDAFDVSREFVEEWKRIDQKPKGFDSTVREGLIKIGDGFRQIKANIWIELAFRDQKVNQIISDCRYINECEYINKRNGISILMYRPGYENFIPSQSEQSFVPIIETLKKLNFDGEIPKKLDLPFHLWVRNDGSIQDLYKKIDDIVVPFVKKHWN